MYGSNEREAQSFQIPELETVFLYGFFVCIFIITIFGV